MPVRVNQRAQIDIVNMEDQETKKFKFFFVYEDQCSKYVILQALESNNIEEIVDKLIDIFAILGAPQIIQSLEGEGFVENLVKEIKLRIPVLNILHDCIIDKDQQPTNRRDFKNLVISWKMENPTCLWYDGLKIIQVLENMTLSSNCHNKFPAEFIFSPEILQDMSILIRYNGMIDRVWSESDEINVKKHIQESQDENNQVDNLLNYSTEDKKEESLIKEELENQIIPDSEQSKKCERLFQCSMCDKKYLKSMHLTNHMRSHKKSLLECTLCVKSFRWKSLYEKHMKIRHSKEKSHPKKNDIETSLITTESPSEDHPIVELNVENDREKVLKKDCSSQVSTGDTAVKSDDNSDLKCLYCKRKFSFRSVLARHMRTHTDERPYICQICGKSFKQSGHLSQHTLTHSDHRSLQCVVCDVKLTTLDALKNHSLTHKEDSSSNKFKNISMLFECDICKKVFPTKSVLERHILTHTHERQFSCKICGNRFKQASHLKAHMLVHTGERKFECIICFKRFGFANSLKKHMYVHNGNKPYQCDVCGARFLERRNLNGHLLTHTNERPFACKFCDKRYTLADTLKRHVNSAHQEGRTYQCEICAKMFKQLAHLSVHKKVHMDERPYQCHLCEKNFKHKNVLKSHLAVHANVRSFECDVCKATFIRKTNLQTHIISAHMNERPYVCTICHKRFKQASHLNGHLIIHSNSLPYQCDFCDRRCNRLDNLKKHMRLHTENDQ